MYMCNVCPFTIHMLGLGQSNGFVCSPSYQPNNRQTLTFVAEIFRMPRRLPLYHAVFCKVTKHELPYPYACAKV
jgi:hypothetical protein